MLYFGWSDLGRSLGTSLIEGERHKTKSINDYCIWDFSINLSVYGWKIIRASKTTYQANQAFAVSASTRNSFIVTKWINQRKLTEIWNKFQNSTDALSNCQGFYQLANIYSKSEKWPWSEGRTYLLHITSLTPNRHSPTRLLVIPKSRHFCKRFHQKRYSLTNEPCIFYSEIFISNFQESFIKGILF